MKKFLALLVTAAMLCACLAGCITQPEETQPTSQPTTAPFPSASETTEPDSGTESTVPSVPGTNVTPPGDMPEKPDADYSLPPDERPGQRGDVKES